MGMASFGSPSGGSLARGLVGDAQAVRAKLLPGLAGASGPEVWAAVFLAAAHDGRSDARRPPHPGRGAGPATCAHQAGEGLADGGRRDGCGLGPVECSCPGLLDRDEHEPGAELRYVMVAGVEQLPPRLVAQVA
jgi:hypothetical protein